MIPRAIAVRRSMQPRAGVGAHTVRCSYGTRVATPWSGAVRIGVATVASVPGGVSFATPSAGNYWRVSPVKVLSALDVFTMAVLFSTTRAGAAGGYALLGERGASGLDIMKIVYGEAGHSSPGVGAVMRNSAGSLQRISYPSVAVNDGRPHTVVLRKSAANAWALFLDGAQVGTNSASLPGSGFTGATPLNVCYDLQDTGKAFEGVSLAVAVPGRAWTAEQVRQFHANPWACALRPRRLYVPRPAGVAAQEGVISLALECAAVLVAAADVEAAAVLAAELGAVHGANAAVAAALTIAGALAIDAGALGEFAAALTLPAVLAATVAAAAEIGAAIDLAAGLAASDGAAADLGAGIALAVTQVLVASEGGAIAAAVALALSAGAGNAVQIEYGGALSLAAGLAAAQGVAMTAEASAALGVALVAGLVARGVLAAGLPLSAIVDVSSAGALGILAPDGMVYTVRAHGRVLVVEASPRTLTVPGDWNTLH